MRYPAKLKKVVIYLNLLQNGYSYRNPQQHFMEISPVVFEKFCCQTDRPKKERKENSDENITFWWEVIIAQLP